MIAWKTLTTISRNTFKAAIIMNRLTQLFTNRANKKTVLFDFPARL